jgi:hypothetical protein
LAATLLRIAIFRHRWFVFTAAVLLQALLNGLVGISYLAAGAIAAVLAALAIGYSSLRSGRAAAPGGGAS